MTILLFLNAVFGFVVACWCLLYLFIPGLDEGIDILDHVR